MNKMSVNSLRVSAEKRNVKVRVRVRVRAEFELGLELHVAHCVERESRCKLRAG